MEGVTTQEQMETTSTEGPFLHLMPDEDDLTPAQNGYIQLQSFRKDRWRENIIALLNGDE